MIPLIINEVKLKRLRFFAEDPKNRITLAEGLAIVNGEALVVGDRDGHSCNLDVGWRVVYSVEEHPLKSGEGSLWFRHMSMSQAMPGRYPNQFSLGLVSEVLGFPKLKNCAIIRPNEVDGVMEVLAQFHQGI
jgi:hypothetical protein